MNSHNSPPTQQPSLRSEGALKALEKRLAELSLRSSRAVGAVLLGWTEVADREQI